MSEISRRSSTDDSITLDIFKFILQPSTEPAICEFLGLTLLEDVFRRYNTTLSSSAPVERIFSKALIVFTSRRNRLSDENFEKALFVHQNFRKYLKHLHTFCDFSNYISIFVTFSKGSLTQLK